MRNRRREALSPGVPAKVTPSLWNPILGKKRLHCPAAVRGQTLCRRVCLLAGQLSNLIRDTQNKVRAGRGLGLRPVRRTILRFSKTAWDARGTLSLEQGVRGAEPPCVTRPFRSSVRLRPRTWCENRSRDRPFWRLRDPCDRRSCPVSGAPCIRGAGRTRRRWARRR